jgi:hypothetical protein
MLHPKKTHIVDLISNVIQKSFRLKNNNSTYQPTLIQFPKHLHVPRQSNKILNKETRYLPTGCITPISSRFTPNCHCRHEFKASKTTTIRITTHPVRFTSNSRCRLHTSMLDETQQKTFSKVDQCHITLHMLSQILSNSHCR